MILPFLVLSQKAEKANVLLEICTGTWCGWCPGAAVAADSLILAGHHVAVIENHYGDAYENTYSLARINYYNLSAYPTAKFDGTLTFAGGAQCPEPYGIYGEYVPLVNARLEIESPVLLSTEFFPVGVNDYQLTVRAIKVGTLESENLKLRVAITESHIAESWLCLEELDFVTRLMVPDANGTAIDFSNGNEVILTIPFTIDPSWNKEHLELVAFIQNDTGKEVLQTVKAPFPLFSRDAMLLKLEDITTANCTGVLQPSFTIANNGAEVLTSLMIHYQINDDPLVSFQWTGNIPYTDSEVVQLNPVTFAPGGNNTFLLYGSSPNGNNDQNYLNDTMSVAFPTGHLCSTYKVALTLLTDENPDETTFEVINSLGEVIASGGPFEMANTIVRDTFELLSTDCYRFIINDAGCDGLTGDGYYQLKEAKSGGYMIYFHAVADEFTCRNMTEFQIEWVGLDDHLRAEPVTIFPNPFNKQTELRLNLQKSDDVSVAIFDITGKQVYRFDLGVLPSGEHVVPVSWDQAAPGLNFMRINIGNKVYTEKLIRE